MLLLQIISYFIIFNTARLVVSISVDNTQILAESRQTITTQNENKSNNIDHHVLPVIEIVGSKFFNTETGEQFFLKGIAYQPSRTIPELKELEKQKKILKESNNGHTTVANEVKYIDPLASPALCLRDLPYLKKLGVNSIRVYSVDPTKNHDICMEAYARSGIYVLLDLSEPDNSIVRENPTWNTRTFQRYKDVVDAMSKYSNLLGYFAGNEVTTDRTNTFASSFVKASIRDIKDYIKNSNHRNIPVGYATNDDPETRDNLARYFVCGEQLSEAVDFYAINMYEWCGYSSYSSSGFRDRTKEFYEFPVPIFFSEFGCNTVRPRPFTEVETLFGPLMTKTWSGGIAYMYFEEENGYGVVKVNENQEIEELEDFKFLKNEFGKAKPNGVTKDSYKGKKNPKKWQCPKTNTLWKASERLPPIPNASKCSCLTSDMPCFVENLESPEEYQKLFNYTCGLVNCSELKNNDAQSVVLDNSDTETHIYGTLADCSIDEQLSFVISKLYFLKNAGTNSCPLRHKAVKFNPKFGSQNSCSEVLKLSKTGNSELTKITKDKKNSDGKYKQSTDKTNEKTTAKGSVQKSETNKLFSKNIGYIILILTLTIYF